MKPQQGQLCQIFKDQIERSRTLGASILIPTLFERPETIIPFQQNVLHILHYISAPDNTCAL